MRVCSEGKERERIQIKLYIHVVGEPTVEWLGQLCVNTYEKNSFLYRGGF